jgi:hypothetical protein
MLMQHASQSIKETSSHVAICEKLDLSKKKGKYRDVLDRSDFPVAAKVGHSRTCYK